MAIPLHPQPQDDRLISIGSTGLKQYGGYVREEFHPKLTGNLAAKVYREMSDNDAVIGAVLNITESLIRQVPWSVRAASQDALDVEAAEFVESCLADMSHTWEDLLSEVLSMLPYGWAWLEKVYKVRRGPAEADPAYRSKYTDGRFGWRKIAIRSQDTLLRWEFDPVDGSVAGMWQLAPPSYRIVLIPIEKSILFRTKTWRGNPEGRSILRNAYRSWYLLKRTQEIEAIGIERDLAGLPVLEVPTELLMKSATTDQKALLTDLQTMVQEIRRDEREGAVVPTELDREGKPTGYRLTLLATGGARAVNADAVVRRYESRIAASLLGEFVLLGSDGRGSYSMHSDKTAMFELALASILDSIAATFNQFAIAPLMALNGYAPETAPTLVHGDLSKPALAELGAFLAQATAAGVLTPDRALERDVREKANLPAPDGDQAAM